MRNGLCISWKAAPTPRARKSHCCVVGQAHQKMAPPCSSTSGASKKTRMTQQLLMVGMPPGHVCYGSTAVAGGRGARVIFRRACCRFWQRASWWPASDTVRAPQHAFLRASTTAKWPCVFFGQNLQRWAWIPRALVSWDLPRAAIWRCSWPLLTMPWTACM